MFKFLDKLKYNLSHINAKSWHWQAVEWIWKENAEGKACTYYWVKLPLSLLALLLIFVLVVVAALIVFPLRLLAVGLAWIFGRSFTENVWDIDDAVTKSWNYTDYKEDKSGNRKRVAPWEILAIVAGLWLAWYFLTMNPAAGMVFLFGLGLIAVVAVVVYLLSAGWKNPAIKQARAKVRAAWDKACPTLVVDYRKS